MAATELHFEDRGYEWVCRIRPRGNAMTGSVTVRTVFVWVVFAVVVGLRARGGAFTKPIQVDLFSGLFLGLLVLALVGYLLWVTAFLIRTMLSGEGLTVSSGTLTLQGQPPWNKQVTIALADIQSLTVQPVREKQLLLTGWLLLRTREGKRSCGRFLGKEKAEELRAILLQRYGKQMDLTTSSE